MLKSYRTATKLDMRLTNVPIIFWNYAINTIGYIYIYIYARNRSKRLCVSVYVYFKFHCRKRSNHPICFKLQQLSIISENNLRSS